MNCLTSVLFFTHSQHGQANVCLATAYELALAGVDVHIASFAPLKSRVSWLQDLATHHSSRSNRRHTGSIVFHEFKDFPSIEDALHKLGQRIQDLRHPHGIVGALKSYSKMFTTVFPWSPQEYLIAIENCKKIVETITPNVAVIDMFLYPAKDACELVNQKSVVILPNSIKEVAAKVQPYLAYFWKYPAISSGFPYPLKWWQIPLNIYLNIRHIIAFVTDANVRPIQALRTSLGLPSDVGFRACSGITHICPGLIETDFSYAVIPKELRLCGPIVLPFDPLEEIDPELKKWLDDRPTVMINLGSHVESDVKFARAVTGAIRILLACHDKERSDRQMQVLWKVKANGDVQRAIDEIVRKEISEGTVKVVPWLNVEPVSILQHPNVVCTVHHGGANSFYEGVWSGVPQIILPVWFDTFDYACRVEYLNIGLFGNKTCAPDVQAEEFGTALVRVTGHSQEAVALRASAQRLREVCRAKGSGRELASAAILKEIGMNV
ncbi:glycosyltransferase family 1 protein [Chiua virens]|nr:glycosyltransferase family 1 protein [Chiua virens]